VHGQQGQRARAHKPIAASSGSVSSHPPRFLESAWRARELPQPKLGAGWLRDRLCACTWRVCMDVNGVVEACGGHSTPVLVDHARKGSFHKQKHCTPRPMAAGPPPVVVCVCVKGYCACGWRSSVSACVSVAGWGEVRVRLRPGSVRRARTRKIEDGPRNAREWVSLGGTRTPRNMACGDPHRGPRMRVRGVVKGGERRRK